MMRKVVVPAVLALAGIMLAVSASAEDGGTTPRPRIYASAPDRPLTGPSNAAPAAIVAGFLQAQGVSPAVTATMRTASAGRNRRTEITHVRLEQEVAGLRVFDAYVKAALNDRGELVHVIESLADVRSADVRSARIDERGALEAALRELRFGLQETPAESGRQGNVVTFARGGFFYDAPRVERVAIAAGDGSLAAGFLVETWTEQRNLLHETLVSGDGAVVAVELRTSSDSYNVFPIHPHATPQRIVAGPGSGNAQSPAGWLFAGSHTSVDIAGNNAHAYLDTNADNASDGGGAAVADGNFVTTADLTTAPSTPTNQNAAVQNLFYHNNVIHDTLYTHGFTEVAGNFQEDNFGLSRRGGSDSVNAEAQDGSGTDNANFATPRDGSNPRMQMFLWTGKGDHTVTVNAPASIAADYRAQGAAFGPALSTTGVTADVVLADDATGTTSDACEAITNDVTGRIALIDRGTCTFVIKVKNAQNAGAVGAIVANNQGGDAIFTMGGTDATITIPSVFVSQNDGATLKSAAGVNATIKKTDPPPLMRDSALDSDIVWHEYGHGLTWRMIGKMSGPMSGAVGEGMSDVLAILITENDRVGEYSFDDPAGIRRFPYTNYPNTYGDVTGGGVHDDGEVYAAIGWRLFELFQGAAISKETLLFYLVDGMNYTPAGPSFEEMRDGILQSVTNPVHECLVWRAFAQYGVGVGAQGRVRGSTVVITESFALPPECR